MGELTVLSRELMLSKLDLSTPARFYGIVQVSVADISLTKQAICINYIHSVATGWYVELKLASLVCDGP